MYWLIKESLSASCVAGVSGKWEAEKLKERYVWPVGGGGYVNT